MAAAVRQHAICILRLVALLVLAPPVVRRAQAAAPFLPWQKCRNSGSYAANSTYQSNLGKLSATVPANVNASRNLFVADKVGAAPDVVFVLALCRGDINWSACESCVAKAFQDAQELCPLDKDATVFEELCHIRYSDLNFLATMDNGEPINVMSALNVTSPVAAFDAAVHTLLDAMSNYTAAANSSTRFATGEEGFDSSNPTIYGLTQCTPDMSPADCRGCLAGLISMLPEAQPGRTGGRLSGLRCTVRYDVYHFFYGTSTLQLPAPVFAPTPSPVTPAATPGGRTSWRRHAATVSVIVLGVTVILLSVTVVFLWRNKGTTRLSYQQDGDDPESLLFDLTTLRRATDNFAEENKLGHGGFGAVYKGVLPHGREIAVKRLDKASGQGLKELRNELLLVAKLKHNNLAKLLGVCLKGEEKLLVYEYLPNRSLDTFLFAPEIEKPLLLRWETRYRIIYGTARGLLYLHEDSQIKIIHRDLKASNILLDADMNPKISDFGLARLFNSDKPSTTTGQVVGTLGYIAPEYAVLGHLSVKLDVYSFGVLLLEIVTGRKNTDAFEESSAGESGTLLNYVWDHWSKGTALETMDPSLDCTVAEEGEVLKCVHLGLLCVQENPADRPTMLNVLVMLHGDVSSFIVPSKPAFTFTFARSSHNSGLSGSDPAVQGTTSVAPSVNEMSLSEFEPR